MHVGVDEPGHDGPTAQIEHSRAGSDEIIEIVAADSENASVGDGQTARTWLGRVQRDDGGVSQQYVGLHRAAIVSAMILHA